LPDLDNEIQSVEKMQVAVDLPEPEPWFTKEDLDPNAGGLPSSDDIAIAMKPHMDEYENAMDECRRALEEAEELLKLQDLSPSDSAL